MSIPTAFNPHDFEPQALEAACTLPACVYADPAFHTFDAGAIFERSWQLIGRAESLRTAGDHVVAEVAGKPLVAVRGGDGALRVFFNVCRHRAGPLALCDGHARELRCKYHGWTYTLEGQLRAAHEMEGAAGFDKTSIHLERVPAVEWDGLVFAALRDAPVPLERVLDGIRARIAPITLADMRFHSRVTYDVACNWKVYVDNYLEGYHLPHVHPGLNRLLDYRAYETLTADWYSWQQSPLDGARGPYEGGTAQYYFVYPNLMLNILPQRLQTNLVVPVSQRQCRVVFDYYYADAESPATKEMIVEDLRFSDEVQKEDIGICERVQVGLESGAYQAGRLSPKREVGVHHFHELIRAAYRRTTSEMRS